MLRSVNLEMFAVLAAWAGRGGGGEGGPGDGNFLYGIVRMNGPFFIAARYMIGPLFSTKSI